MSDLSKKALELFNQGYSCSESVVRAALELGFIDNKIDIESLTRISSAFSGGMGGSGCLCGAVAGAQITIGYIFGRNDNTTPSHSVKAVAKKLVEKFKEKNKATCCRVLNKGRDNCAGLVSDAAEILENLVNENLDIILISK